MADTGRQDFTGEVINNGEFKLAEKLGKGAFGDVYKVEAISGPHKGKTFAAKIEQNLDPDNPVDQLYAETKMYLWLNNKEESVNHAVPEVYSYGQHAQPEFKFMVMDLLGKSLEDLFAAQQRQFSLKTTISIAVQVIPIFKFVHENRLLHRDIKPDNFAVGYGDKSNKIYLLDFGLAKRFQAPVRDGGIRHIEPADNKPLVGTPRYVSINTHDKGEHSRKDDMIGLSYMFLYFLKGSLPWQGKKELSADEKIEHMKNVKKQMHQTPDILFQGVPKVFKDFYLKVNALGFTDKPNYDEYVNDFMNLYRKLGFGQNLDYKYDWS